MPAIEISEFQWNLQAFLAKHMFLCQSVPSTLALKYPELKQTLEFKKNWMTLFLFLWDLIFNFDAVTRSCNSAANALESV